MKKDKRGPRKHRKSRTTPIKRSHTSRSQTNDLLTERINEYANRENWDAIIETLKPLLEEEPDDHWLLAEIASAYYEKRDYDTAYKYIIDAMYYQENCPLVLWHLASIFRMLDRQQDAITVWEELIDRGPERLAFDECGEGLERANSLIADSKYMISKSYRELGENELAESFKESYYKDVAAGIKSIYDPSTL